MGTNKDFENYGRTVWEIVKRDIVDGGMDDTTESLADLAVKHNLCKYEEYDRDKHGEVSMDGEEIKEGSDIYWWGDEYPGITNNYIAVAADELGDEIGSEIDCPHCGSTHEIEYPDRILSDGTQEPSKILSFYNCGKKSYLAGVHGKKIPYTKILRKKGDRK